MQLTLDNLFKFLKREYKSTKKNIAKKVFYAHDSKLRPGAILNDYDLDCLYNGVFNLKNKNSFLYGKKESELVKSLKKEFKDDLEDIWDKEYDDLIKIVLASANVRPPTEDSSSNECKGASHKETPSNQMRDSFIEIVERYGIMDLVNRKPAVFNRADSTKFSIFIDRIDLILNDPTNLVYTSIQQFQKKLHMQYLSLEATMNNRFGFDCESASVNMEDEDDFPESKKVLSRYKIPNLSMEIIADSDDRFNIVKLAVKEWGNFRNEMNFLYEEICLLP